MFGLFEQTELSHSWCNVNSNLFANYVPLNRTLTTVRDRLGDDTTLSQRSKLSRNVIINLLHKNNILIKKTCLPTKIWYDKWFIAISTSKPYFHRKLCHVISVLYGKKTTAIMRKFKHETIHISNLVHLL